MQIENQTEIGIGVIGAGDASPNHLKGMTYLSEKGVRLIGIYDLQAEKARVRANQYNCRTFNSTEELMSSPEISAVLVLTPPEIHFSNVKMALEAGKHVLVEKPVGTSVAEIKEMKRLAGQKGLVCMPGHNNIYHPTVEVMKRRIDNGDLGQLSYISLLYNIYHPEEVANRYPGVIREVMTHHIYTLLYLAGTPTSVQAIKATQHYQEFKGEDIALANFEMVSGALAHLEVNFTTDDHGVDPWSLYMKVLGEKGSTSFSYNTGIRNIPEAVHSHVYLSYPESIGYEDQAFIECIRGSKKPLSSLDDAIDTQKIVEAIELSITERKTINL